MALLYFLLHILLKFCTQLNFHETLLLTILVPLEALVEAGEVTADVIPWVLLTAACTVQALAGVTKMIHLDWMEAGPTAA